MSITSEFDNIHHGDCLDYLRGLPDACVDLVVSSPPYNIGKEYESKRSLESYLAEQRQVLRECARVLKDSGSIFWQVGAYADNGILIPLDVKFFPILEELGMQPRNRIIWVRQHGLHAQNKFSCRHETILWFTKSADYKFSLDPVRVPQKYQNKKHWKGEKQGELSCNPLGKNPSDIWVFRNVKQNHEEQTIHPCQFPEDMIARIVLSTTDEDDVVLDPYMGTGTVAVVAKDYGRRYAGAELDGDYYKVAIRRIDGTPDVNGCFANLKTLRNYCDKTGESIEKFRFDTQVSAVPTSRDKARILPESHHLEELERRLSFEEDSFSAKIKGEQAPVDENLNGKLNSHFYKTRIEKKEKKSNSLPLFSGANSR